MVCSKLMHTAMEYVNVVIGLGDEAHSCVPAAIPAPLARSAASV